MSATLLGNKSKRYSRSSSINGAFGQVGKTKIEHKFIRHLNKREAERAMGVFSKMQCSLAG